MTVWAVNMLKRSASPIGYSKCSLSAGEHPAIPGYFLRNHLTGKRQEATLTKRLTSHHLLNSLFQNNVKKKAHSRCGSETKIKVLRRQTGMRWLTGRRGKAGAAWIWRAPGRGSRWRAAFPPTCPPVPCPSPSAGRSSRRTAPLPPRSPRPDRCSCTAPWRRRSLWEGAEVPDRTKWFRQERNNKCVQVSMKHLKKTCLFYSGSCHVEFLYTGLPKCAVWANPASWECLFSSRPMMDVSFSAIRLMQYLVRFASNALQ